MPTSAMEHHRDGRRLQLFTILWNCGEVIVTVTLGLLAGSLALVAFGLDSLIEVFTSTVVLWHMGPTVDDDDPTRDGRARKLVGLAFAALSAYLLISSVRALLTQIEPDASPLGILYLGATAVVMLILARSKRRTGGQLASGIFLAEARMTQLDAYLAMAILTALAANAIRGWWWADPLAAAVVGLIAAREAHEGLTGTS